jgi:hypothetical protein
MLSMPRIRFHYAHQKHRKTPARVYGISRISGKFHTSKKEVPLCRRPVLKTCKELVQTKQPDLVSIGFNVIWMLKSGYDQTLSAHNLVSLKAKESHL